MDHGTVIGLVTGILMLIFVGIVVWAWSKRRAQGFAGAARLPLEEDPR